MWATANILKFLYARFGVGEMAHNTLNAKVWRPQSGFLHLDYCQLWQNLLLCWGSWGRRILGSLWPVSLVRMGTSTFNERLLLRKKKQYGGQHYKSHMMSTFGLHTCTHGWAHLHVHTRNIILSKDYNGNNN